MQNLDKNLGKRASKETLEAIRVLSNNDMLSDDDNMQVFAMLVNDDCAEFLAEWHPELIPIALDVLYYDYGAPTFAVMNEEELQDFLSFYEVNEEGYEESYGWIIRDNAFEGVLVVGE